MKYFYSIVIICLLSCNSRKEEVIPSAEMCECYSKSSEINIDEKFNSCLDFVKISQNTDSKKAQEEVANIVKKLIKECPKYQSDFNKSFVDKFENPNPQLVSQKDSLVKCVDAKIETAKNYSKLAEISIQEKNFDQAMIFIDKAISIEKDNEYCHWIKSYLFQKKNDFGSAIEEFKFINKTTTNSNSKAFNDLMIENLEAEKANIK